MSVMLPILSIISIIKNGSFLKKKRRLTRVERGENRITRITLVIAFIFIITLIIDTLSSIGARLYVFFGFLDDRYIISLVNLCRQFGFLIFFGHIL